MSRVDYAFHDDGAVIILSAPPPVWELHLPPDPKFTANGWGRRVRAAGGSYVEARGATTRRFVSVPGTAGELVDALVAAFAAGKALTAVVRGVPRALPTWAVMVRVESAARPGPAAAMERAWSRNLQRMASDPRIPVVPWNDATRAAFAENCRAKEQDAFAREVERAVTGLVGLLARLEPGVARVVLAAVRAGLSAARRRGADVSTASAEAGDIARRSVAPAPARGTRRVQRTR